MIQENQRLQQLIGKVHRVSDASTQTTVFAHRRIPQKSKREVDGYIMELKRLSDALELEKNEKQKLFKVIQELEHCRELQKCELEALNRKFKKMSDNYKDAMTRCQSLVNERDQILSRNQKSLDNKFCALDSELKELKEKFDTVCIERNDLRARNAALQDMITHDCPNCIQKPKQINDNYSQALESKVQTLEIEREDLESRVVYLTRLCASQSERIASLDGGTRERTVSLALMTDCSYL